MTTYFGRNALLSTMAQAQTVSVNGRDILQIGSHNAEEILEKYDTVLLDCDGVVWAMDHVTHLPGVAKAVISLQKLGKQVLFVTNNSMHGRRAYVKKFNEHGFEASPDDVFCVAYASALYIHEIMHVKGSVYVIGSQGMAEELDDIGVPNFGVGPDPDQVYGAIPDLLDVPLRDDVSAVLVGYDKHFNMRKLFKVCSYLENKNCIYLATNNIEKSVLIGPGRRQPVTGAIVDCVTSAAKRAPAVVGKPDAHLFTCIKATHPSLLPGRTLMIGDSIPGDIGFAKAAGLDSALVLTGSSNLNTISLFPGLEPNYFMSSLAAFNFIDSSGKIN